MNAARIMEDGELRLPPEVAERLNVKPGDSVGVEMGSDGTVRLYPKKGRIEDVCGMLHPPSGIHLTIEQMDGAVASAGLKPAEVSAMLGARTKVKVTIEQMDQGIAEAFRRGEL